MGTVPAPQVATPNEAAREELPEAVQLTLGELAGAAREGRLALSVGVGLGVVNELMAAEVEEVCGPKGRHDAERAATRWSTESGSVTLGGRRVPVERPRMRTPDGGQEVPLRTYGHFASRDPLTDLVFERIMAGVSARGYERANEPVGSEVEAESTSTSKSAVSREFVERTRTALGELMGRRLDDVRLAVMMIDGLELAGRTHVVAMGITTQGVKVPLGLWEGSTENATVATALLSDLVDRGLDPEQGILFVIDGAKALRKAVADVFGTCAPVQRCVRHKERNVLDHLGEADRAPIRGRPASGLGARRPRRGAREPARP
jgi:putative transposase